MDPSIGIGHGNTATPTLHLHAPVRCAPIYWIGMDARHRCPAPGHGRRPCRSRRAGAVSARERAAGDGRPRSPRVTSLSGFPPTPRPDHRGRCRSHAPQPQLCPTRQFNVRACRLPLPPWLQNRTLCMHAALSQPPSPAGGLNAAEVTLACRSRRPSPSPSRGSRCRHGASAPQVFAHRSGRMHPHPLPSFHLLPR